MIVGGEAEAEAGGCGQAPAIGHSCPFTVQVLLQSSVEHGFTFLGFSSAQEFEERDGGYLSGLKMKQVDFQMVAFKAGRRIKQKTGCDLLIV